MARTGRKKPGLRVLVWLGVLLAALTAVLAGGTIAGQASWSPKLALDLEGHMGYPVDVECALSFPRPIHFRGFECFELRVRR